MFTPGQVSDMLGIPPSTLRRYAKLFESHLTDQRGRIRRLYSERDILVFAKVHELSKLNQPLDKVGPLLDLIDEPTIETKPNALSLIPEVAAEIESSRDLARSALSQLATLETAMLANNEKLASQLAASLEDQKAISDKLYYFLSLPWWKKLFYKFPPE